MTVFSLSSSFSPLSGAGIEALSLQRLLRSSGEQPAVPCPREPQIESRIYTSDELKNYKRVRVRVRVVHQIYITYIVTAELFL